jgi:tetratricopeptide (TPR) repeat protein
VGARSTAHPGNRGMRHPLAKTACLFLMIAVLSRVPLSAAPQKAVPAQRSATQPPSGSRTSKTQPASDELQKRQGAAAAAKESGNLEAIAHQNELLIALGLREIGKRRMFASAFPEAADLYRRSLQFEDAGDAHSDLAIAYLYMKRPEDSIAEASKALASDPLNATTWNTKGEALMSKKDYQGAIEPLQRSIEIRGDLESTYALGICYLGLMQKEKATDIFQQMVSVAGDHGWLHMLFGRAYWDVHMLDDARREFQRSLDLDPKTPDAHYLLGLTRLMQNEWAPNPESRSEFLQELQLNPRSFAASYMLGFMASSAKDYEESNHYLRIAVEARPSSPETWLYLGLNAYARKENAQAEKLLRKAIMLAEPEGAMAHYEIRKGYFTLGRILIVSGKKDEGEKYIQKARALEQLIMADSQQDSRSPATISGAGMGGAPVPALPEKDDPTSRARTMGKDTVARVDAPALSPANSTSAPKKAATVQEKYLRGILGASFNDLATAEAMREQYALAFEHYQEAERWDPTVPNLKRNLGFAAFGAGDYADATHALSSYLKTSPTDEATRRVLQLAYDELQKQTGQPTAPKPTGKQP